MSESLKPQLYVWKIYNRSTFDYQINPWEDLWTPVRPAFLQSGSDKKLHLVSNNPMNFNKIGTNFNKIDWHSSCWERLEWNFTLNEDFRSMDFKHIFF